MSDISCLYVPMLGRKYSIKSNAKCQMPQIRHIRTVISSNKRLAHTLISPKKQARVAKPNEVPVRYSFDTQQPLLLPQGSSFFSHLAARHTGSCGAGRTKHSTTVDVSIWEVTLHASCTGIIIIKLTTDKFKIEFL